MPVPETLYRADALTLTRAVIGEWHAREGVHATAGLWWSLCRPHVDAFRLVDADTVRPTVAMLRESLRLPGLGETLPGTVSHSALVL